MLFVSFYYFISSSLSNSSDVVLEVFDFAACSQSYLQTIYLCIDISSLYMVSPKLSSRTCTSDYCPTASIFTYFLIRQLPALSNNVTHLQFSMSSFLLISIVLWFLCAFLLHIKKKRHTAFPNTYFFCWLNCSSIWCLLNCQAYLIDVGGIVQLVSLLFQFFLEILL